MATTEVQEKDVLTVAQEAVANAGQTVKELNTAFDEAVAAQDRVEILKSSGMLTAGELELAKARKALDGAERDANAGAIAGVETEILNQIRGTLEAYGPGWANLSKMVLENVVVTVSTVKGEGDSEEDEIRYGIAINQKMRAARKATGKGKGSGGTRNTVFNRTVKRTVNGAVEEMTVKEACLQYSSEDLKGSTIAEKNHYVKWFEKLNAELEDAGQPVFEMVE